MAGVITVPMRSAVSVKVNAGTDPVSGDAITRSVAINGVKANADAEMILNVVDLLANVLEHNVTRVEYTEVKSLERNG